MVFDSRFGIAILWQGKTFKYERTLIEGYHSTIRNSC